MGTNAGVIVLASRTGRGFGRLEIEDNIGEGIHIHYKNFRLDYSIKDFLEFARACEEALDSLNLKIVRNEVDPKKRATG